RAAPASLNRAVPTRRRSAPSVPPQQARDEVSEGPIHGPAPDPGALAPVRPHGVQLHRGPGREVERAALRAMARVLAVPACIIASAGEAGGGAGSAGCGDALKQVVHAVIHSWPPAFAYANRRHPAARYPSPAWAPAPAGSDRRGRGSRRTPRGAHVPGGP